MSNERTKMLSVVKGDRGLTLLQRDNDDNGDYDTTPSEAVASPGHAALLWGAAVSADGPLGAALAPGWAISVGRRDVLLPTTHLFVDDGLLQIFLLPTLKSFALACYQSMPGAAPLKRHLQRLHISLKI